MRRPVALPRLQTVVRRLNRGLGLAIVYALLIVFAFTLAYPFLYMVVTSLKTIPEYLNPLVTWVPTHVDWGNYLVAWAALHYRTAAVDTLFMSTLGAAAQVLAACFVGYGFGRASLAFPGRGILLALVVLTLVVPPETVIVALYRLYVFFHWINTPWPFIVPGLFGQGLRGGLFILVFRQTYGALPVDVEEAGRLDGASPWRIWWRLMLPQTGPAITVCGVLSFIWHWNSYFEPLMFLNGKFSTLTLRFAAYISSVLANPAASSFASYNVSVIMSEAILTTLPLLIVYALISGRFLQSFSRVGVSSE